MKDGAHTHGGGGDGLGELVLVILALALAEPAAAAAVVLVHALAVIVEVLAGVAVAVVAVLVALRVRAARKPPRVPPWQRPGAIQAAQRPVTAPREVHLHLHGATAEQAESIARQLAGRPADPAEVVRARSSRVIHPSRDPRGDTR